MKETKKEKDWFKLKRYPHIGFPLKAKDRVKWIEKYIQNPTEIATHSFLPFIHKTSLVRKFRKEYSESDGTIIKKVYEKEGIKDIRILRKKDTKTRELYYAGHLDSLVFSYYADLLQSKYEKQIEINGLKDVVTAYRKIQVYENQEKPNKCNIEFATDVFKLIKNYPSTEFVAIAFDISKFFDNLNHQTLRNSWKSILDLNATDKMPPDHFNVFKNITRFSYIDIVDLFTLFQDKIFVQGTENGKPKIKRKRISKIKYMKKQNAIAFCTTDEFLQAKFKLIKKDFNLKDENGNIKIRNYGIPQGSPISATLANIYMLGFDIIINKYLSSIKGFYRRYSDDMVVICPKDKKKDVIEMFMKEIQEIKLDINPKKTQIFHFVREESGLFCGQEFKDIINYNKNFIYLGLEFDGSIVKLKSASLSNFYRKMKRTIRRGNHYSAIETSPTSGELFKRRILKRFSYKGAQRRMKYLWNKDKGYFEKSHHFDWGNFLSYAAKAKKINFKNVIEKQTSRSWNKLNRLIKGGM